MRGEVGMAPSRLRDPQMLDCCGDAGAKGTGTGRGSSESLWVKSEKDVNLTKTWVENC